MVLTRQIFTQMSAACHCCPCSCYFAFHAVTLLDLDLKCQKMGSLPIPKRKSCLWPEDKTTPAQLQGQGRQASWSVENLLQKSKDYSAQ